MAKSRGGDLVAANIALYKMKVGHDRNNATWQKARDLFETLIYVECERLAAARVGKDSPLVLSIASRATLLALDAALACRLFHVSTTILRLYVKQALRESNGWRDSGKNVDDLPQPPEVELRPAWEPVMESLIALTRRSWIFLWLSQVRDPGTGWLDRLAGRYVPKGNAYLTGQKDDWQDAHLDLVQATAQVAPIGTNAADPVQVVVDHLSAACLTPGFVNASRAVQATVILAAIRLLSPAGGYQSDFYPDLAAALNVVGAFADTLLPTVAAAVQELSQETAHPAAPGNSLPWPNIESLVLHLSGRPRGAEIAPTEALSSLAALTPPAAADTSLPPRMPSADVIAKDDLVRILSALVDRHSCENMAWYATWEGSGTATYWTSAIWHTLLVWLPDPNMLWKSQAGRAAKVMDVLQRWYVQSLATGTIDEIWYLPDSLAPTAPGGRNLHKNFPQWLEAAIHTLLKWREDPKIAPDSWLTVPRTIKTEVEQTLRAAFTIAILMDLHADLSLVYRAFRKHRKLCGCQTSDEFTRYVLERRSPDFVRQRLNELEKFATADGQKTMPERS